MLLYVYKEEEVRYMKSSKTLSNKVSSGKLEKPKGETLMKKYFENEYPSERSLSSSLKNNFLKNEMKERIHQEILKMNSSRDESYTRTFIPCHEFDGFLVECERCEKLDNERNGGEAYGFRVYYMRGSQECDCCTIGLVLDERNAYEADYLIDMYI